MNKVDIQTAAQMLLQNDDILILCHRSPDGDTLGSGFGLYYSLTSVGKRCRVECSDEITPKFEFLQREYKHNEFEPKFIVAVDIADIQLFGDKTKGYVPNIDLCIDHHPTNSGYAKNLLLQETSAAASEVVKLVVDAMGIKINKLIADCLYTGCCTDTGCFKYSNTTPRTHRIAAELMEAGANYENINKVMFDTKTKAQIAIQKLSMDTLEFYYDNRCAVMLLTDDMIKKTGASKDDTEMLVSITRQIEGVEAGILLKERAEEGKPQAYKISVRTGNTVDASELCANFGGGGHKRASGCLITGTAEHAKEMIVEKLKKYFS